MPVMWAPFSTLCLFTLLTDYVILCVWCKLYWWYLPTHGQHNCIISILSISAAFVLNNYIVLFKMWIDSWVCKHCTRHEVTNLYGGVKLLKRLLFRTAAGEGLIDTQHFVWYSLTAFQVTASWQVCTATSCPLAIATFHKVRQHIL